MFRKRALVAAALVALAIGRVTASATSTEVVWKLDHVDGRPR